MKFKQTVVNLGVLALVGLASGCFSYDAEERQRRAVAADSSRQEYLSTLDQKWVRDDPIEITGTFNDGNITGNILGDWDYHFCLVFGDSAYVRFCNRYRGDEIASLFNEGDDVTLDTTYRRLHDVNGKLLTDREIGIYKENIKKINGIPVNL